MIIYQSSWNIYEPAVESEFFNNLKLYINVIQMPLFISISGYLYYFYIFEKKKQENLTSFTWKKIKRLLFPYGIVSLIYFIPIRMILGFDGYQGSGAIKAVLMVSGIGHLWYLVMLFNVSIIAYALVKYIKNDRSIIIIALLVFFISSGNPSKFEIKRTLFYIIFFMIGYYLRKYRHANLNMKQNIRLFIMHIILSVAFIIYINTIGSNFTIVGKLLFIFANTVGLISYYGLSTNSIENSKISNTINSKLFKTIDRNSLGIYLFHEPIIFIIYSFIGSKSIYPIFLVLVCLILSSSISIVITECSRKMKFYALIGEGK
ncbi:acyltransferase [Clostridium gasigenes]|uniref:acyltransferase family protein n=1 Tax=Clostridium gasigenes TaxID=94869 RepID=UPI001C0D5C0A|nr:acyltransferase [Clostridium gasigenes]MBU3138154.1 acyltransferase [Clostridium gasigenes]